MRKFLFAIFAIIFCVSANAAVDKKLVDQAEKYLNSITGLNGNFVQTANGKQQAGVFSMLRPGRVRLDYDNMPVQLISDGSDYINVTFFNKLPVLSCHLKIRRNKSCCGNSAKADYNFWFNEFSLLS